jgi:hypothetical protein
MRDKWMNIGFEEDDLKPYVEPMPDLSDQTRIGNNSIINFLFQSLKLSRLSTLNVDEDEQYFIIHFIFYF